MKCNILLFGSPSCGKSSMVNTLSLQLYTNTEPYVSPNKDPVYWNFKKKPNDKEQQINGHFEELYIVDTPGILPQQLIKNVYEEVIMNFIQTDNKNPKIIIYMIDSTQPLVDNNLCGNLKYINEKINNQKNNGMFIELFIIFNKCDECANNYHIDGIVDKIKTEVGNFKFLKLSCYFTFIESIKNENLCVKIPNSHDKDEIIRMIKKSGYSYTKNLKLSLEKNLLDSKLLRKKINDDGDEDLNNIKFDNIYDEVKNSIEKSSMMRMNLLENNLNKKFCDYNNSIISDKLDNDKLCAKNITTILKNIIECDAHKSNTVLKNGLNKNISESMAMIAQKHNVFEYPIFIELLNMNKQMIDTIVYDYLIKYIKNMGFETLCDNFINRVNKISNIKNIENDKVANTLIGVLILEDKFYTDNILCELSGLKISKSLNHYIQICTTTVKNLIVFDHLNMINKFTLEKYLGENSLLIFKYMLYNHPKQKTLGNMIKTIKIDKKEEINLFLNTYEKLKYVEDVDNFDEVYDVDDIEKINEVDKVSNTDKKIVNNNDSITSIIDNYNDGTSKIMVVGKNQQSMSIKPKLAPTFQKSVFPNK